MAKIKKLSKEQQEILSLEQQLREANRNASYFEGKHDELKDQEEKRRNQFGIEKENFESEISWLRSLLEFITVPADKLEAYDKMKQEKRRGGY